MAIKHFSAPALLLAALVSLTSVPSHAAAPDELAPGNWPTFNGEVHDILILPDDSFIVGGAFQSVTIDGTTTNRSRLAHINANGTLDASFPSADSTVYCLGTDAAGRIYIGGDFANLTVGVTQTPRIRVARLTSTFAVDAAFVTAAAGPTDDVLALAPVGDGSVVIGGRFDAVGAPGAPESADSKRFAKLKANGLLDTAFKSGATNDVNTILRLPNGTLYVGGITNYWGFKPRQTPTPTTPYARLVKLSAGGARDAAFKSPDIFTIINEVIQLPNGNLFVAGNVGGQAFVKRLNPANGADLGYAVTGHLSQANCVAAQGNDMLLSGALGTFFLTNSTGVKDVAFDVGSAFNSGMINTVKLDKNGRIYIGGGFTYSDGVNTRARFVVLNGYDPRSQSITITPPVNPTFTPGQNVFTIAASSTSGLPVTLAVTSGPATIAGNKLTITGAGTIALTSTQAGNASFDPATPVSIDIIVSKQTQSVSFGGMVRRPSGSTPFLLSGAASSGLPVSYEVLNGPATVNANVLTLTGATGTVTLRASQPGNSDFTAATDVEQSFDVFTGTPAQLPQTIVFNSLSPRSLSEPLTFTLSASATSGLPLTYTFTGPVTSIVGNVVTLSGAVGTVAITAKQAGDANFLPAKDVKQSFVVTAAATTLTLTNLIQTYTGTPREIGTVGGSGSPVISYTIAGVKGTTKPTNVGSYPVEAVIGTGLTAVKKTGSLVINKAPLIVVADDKRKFISQDNPTLSLAYSGFLESDNAVNALTKAPTVTTTAKKTSLGGNYPITPAGGVSANYAFVYMKGNMKVETFAGQYEALLYVNSSSAPTGKVEITIGATSTSYTGKLITAKEATPLPLAGTFVPDFVNETVTFTKAFPRGTGPAATSHSLIFTAPLTGDFSATVTRATGTPLGTPAPLGASIVGKKMLLNTGIPPVAYAGAHTVILDPPQPLNSSVLSLPAGYGHATAAIDSKGKMTLVTTLPDGSKFTASLLPPSVDISYQLYVQPIASRTETYVAGLLTLKDHPDHTGRRYIALSDNVNLYWKRDPRSTDANYKEDGIPESAMLTGLDPWLPPVAAKTPNPAITLAQRLRLSGTGEINVTHSGLGTVTSTGLPATVNIGSTGLVTIPGTAPANNPRAWKLTIAAATGIFSGSYSVLDGSLPRTVKITGVMRQPIIGESDPAEIGAGQGILPQLTGQSNGSTSTEIFLERPVP